ncbi:MAG: hypothetical protein AAGF12_03580 [Myxococcota bacterium]
MRFPGVLLIPFLLVACGGESEGVRAEGEMILEIDGTRSGFVLENNTRIDSGGPVVGSCILRSDPEPTAYRLTSTQLLDGDALRSIEVGFAEGDAFIEVDTGAEPFRAVGPCTIEEPYRDLSGRVGAVEVDCQMISGERSGHLFGELHFSGCR